MAFVGLVAAIAAAGALLIPFMRASITAAGIAGSEALLTSVILFNVGFVTPVGVGIQAVVTAGLLYTFPLFAGQQTRWRRCLAVAIVAAGVEINRRVFMALILWLRELTGRTDPEYQVRTGLDALLVAIPDLPPALVAAAGRIGLFEIWAGTVAAIGLMTAEHLPRRTAVTTAVATALVVNGMLVALQALAR